MRRIAVVMLFLLLLSACAAAPATPMIRLSELQPLPAEASAQVVPLRVSVASVVSPRGTVESYKPLLDYLSARLDRPVELVQRRTYAETNELIGRGEVDLAFVCTSAYIGGRESFGMILLAAPQVAGATSYRSLLLVPADSPARSMADLQGAVFAFTDPTSFSGRVYPTALVQELATTPEQFFQRIFYTYSHDNAINAVADGLADAASVDSLVYDFAVARDPWLAERVRVIHRSPPFGIPPVVVGPDVRPQLRAELQAILLGMADDTTPEAQAALQALGVERFVSIDDRTYDSARAVVDTVGTLTP
ncbi:MAG TPA: phosphate/phosphite/phosphonate ABC transporter substrate-binding protein [Chloroflexaceae bacterium]|nr:phosphate/phosphite/phosphonate ABC transporter substrate-binding protein [Chloroflexaceae bacterium]